MGSQCWTAGQARWAGRWGTLLKSSRWGFLNLPIEKTTQAFWYMCLSDLPQQFSCKACLSRKWVRNGTVGIVATLLQISLHLLLLCSLQPVQLHGASWRHHSTMAPKLGKGWLREGPWQRKEEPILASSHLLMAIGNWRNKLAMKTFPFAAP